MILTWSPTLGMTNEPSGNILVSAPITSNGSIVCTLLASVDMRLTSSQGDISVMATGGLGIHGDSFGVDSIFTQGPIAVHEDTGRLAVVNVSITLQLEAPGVLTTRHSLAQIRFRCSNCRPLPSPRPSAIPCRRTGISLLLRVRSNAFRAFDDT